MVGVRGGPAGSERTAATSTTGATGSGDLAGQEPARAVREAAGSQSTSAWLADAARRKLRAEGLRELVRDWEDEHGEITAGELHRAEARIAAARLGQRPRRKGPKRGR